LPRRNCSGGVDHRRYGNFRFDERDGYIHAFLFLHVGMDYRERDQRDS
jgi:hypothetical protein